MRQREASTEGAGDRAENVPLRLGGVATTASPFDRAACFARPRSPVATTPLTKQKLTSQVQAQRRSDGRRFCNRCLLSRK
jgi:hypothetical protein